jgi:uncharacterized delta-60 repeat protein
MNTRKWTGIKFVIIILSLLLGQRLTFGQEVSGAGAAVKANEGVQAEYQTYLPLVIRQVFEESSGVLDPSFNGNGIVTSDLPFNSDSARAVALQPDGKLVVAGWGSVAGDSDGLVARYTPEGSLDTSFSEDGWAIAPELGYNEYWFYDVVVQVDGKILAFGSAYPDYPFLLVRFNPDGSLDQAFGESGALTTDFPGYTNFPFQVLLQPDGKIVVVGTSYPDDNSQDTVTLVRYNPDGSLDTSFGEDGLVTTDIEAGNDEYAYDMLLQPDGKIVVAGSTFLYFLLVRYR